MSASEGSITGVSMDTKAVIVAAILCETFATVAYRYEMKGELAGAAAAFELAEAQSAIAFDAAIAL